METQAPAEGAVAFSASVEGPEVVRLKTGLLARLGLRSPVRATVIGAVLLSIMVVIVSGLVIRHIYIREVTEAARNLSSFDNLLTHQTEQAFQSVVLVQRGIQEELLSEGLIGPGDLEQLANGRDMHERLRQRIAGLPQLDAITLIATDGHLVNFSRYWPIPSINIADRDYFHILSPANAPSDSIGQPVENRGSGTWTIYVAHRLSGPNHQFAGLILGAIETSYFENFYSQLRLPLGTNIALWRADGLLLAHFPDMAGVGKYYPHDPSFMKEVPGAPPVVTITNQTLDGQQRIVARSRLAQQPIIVSVTRTMANTLSDWWFDTELVIIATVLCVIGIGTLAYLFIRQFRSYEAAAMALTAREEAERSLHEAEAKLFHSQKLEAVGRLTAGVAHDFNNLLTVVRANAELLASSTMEARAMRRIGTICQAADRGAALTRQMLAFSRQQLLTPQSVDLNQCLRDIYELLRSSTGNLVKLEMQLQDNIWPAFVDPSQLEQAILNLVINARDALPEGGRIVIETANVAVTRSDKLSNLAPGDYIRISVSDTGSGMPPDVINRAFDPFFTTKGQGKGTGLGLSQTLGFARQSNGDVLLESTPGSGTRVRILLPRAPMAPRAPEPTARPISDEMPATPPSVMLVDDNEQVRSSAAALLREQGFTVVEAANAADALRTMTGRSDLEVLLTDYAMPDMTGTELAQQLRHRYPSFPVVFMSSFADPDVLAGERWVVRKPFEGDVLADTLRSALAAAREARSS